jgi:outer membrane protein OmpA-like peptidoglycan-associated protein
MKAFQIIIIAILGIVNLSSAQIDLEQRVKDKVKQRAEQRTDEAIDKALDKTEEGAKKAAKGEKKNKKEKDNESNTENNDSNNNSESEGNSEEGSNKTSTSAPAKKSLQTYGKYDFVPGEKIIAQEGFEQVAISDYPVDWNTNSGAEIVNVDGENGKWLMMNNPGVFMPEFITDLPENFTLEFDLICNEEFSYYSSPLEVWLASMTKPEAEFTAYGDYGRTPNAFVFSLHPTLQTDVEGVIRYKNFDTEGNEIISNDISTNQFIASKKNKVHVSVWRQKNRIRVYLNEEKVLDLPRAFASSINYNRITFARKDGTEGDRYLLGNIRFAVGAPDTRSKLITEGKLTTRGILFDSGSDKIKPESYGTLKDIAQVLNENMDVRVMIIGHTDSDGDDAKNLELSKKRAAAVKEALSKDFNVDASRMETDGKGESQPSDKNDTPAGKANNRRVEFVKQ